MAVQNYLLDENGIALEIFPFDQHPSVLISEHLGVGFSFQFTCVTEVDWLIDQLEEMKYQLNSKSND